MTNHDLINLIYGDGPRIVEAISTGAGWEIWMQVELGLILRAAGKQVAREVPYPPPTANYILDLLAGDPAGTYAIELKVESATNAGAAIVPSINRDRTKLLNYPPQVPGARWVVGIAYSFAATQALIAFVNNPANNAIGDHRNGLTVVIATV
jgi:hypothetical protein